MSRADAEFASMDAALFAAFAEQSDDTTTITVQRGLASPVPLPSGVVLTRGVQLLGEYGQAVSTVTTADFINTEWRPKPEDVLHLATGDRKIQKIDSDDGYVTRAVLYG